MKGDYDMATQTMKKVAATMQLENGRDDYGNMKYVSQSFGTLASDGFDGDKLLNIKDGLAPIFSKTVGSVQAVETFEVSRSS